MECMHCSSGRYRPKVVKVCSTCGDVWRATKWDEKIIMREGYIRGLKKSVEIVEKLQIDYEDKAKVVKSLKEAMKEVK